MSETSTHHEHDLDVARVASGQSGDMRAEATLQAAIAEAERLGSESEQLAATLSSLGRLTCQEGNYAGAVAAFRRSLEICEHLLGPDHYGLLARVRDLAAACAARGDVDEVERLLLRALSLTERQFGADHPEVAVCLGDLIRLYFSQNAFANAEPLLLRLRELKRLQGEEHPEMATVLASLATVRHALGRHGDAEQLWRRALEIRERSLAPNHFVIARTLEHLADACAAQGKLEDALALLQRALEMRERTSCATDPSVLATRTKFADLQLLASQEAWGTGSSRPLPLPRRSGGNDLHRGPPGGQEARPAGDAPPTAPTPSDPPRPATGDAPHVLLMERDPARREAPPAPRVWTPEDAFIPLMTMESEFPIDSEFENDVHGENHRASLAAHDSLGRRHLWRTVTALVARARGTRLRTAAVGGAMALTLLAFIAAHHAGAKPAETPLAAAASSHVEADGRLAARTMPQTGPSTNGAAESGALAHAESIAQAEASTPSEASGEVDQSASRQIPAGRGEAASEESRVDASLPTVATARVAGALSAVESSTVRHADSAMRLATEGALVFPGDQRTAANGHPAGPESSGVTAPVLAPGSPIPNYPPALRAADVTGQVLVEFVVDSAGHVEMGTVHVLNSDDALFTRAVREALPRMQFTPADSAGRKVPERLEMPFTFGVGEKK